MSHIITKIDQNKPYFNLHIRGDRYGAIIFNIISQIVYAHYNGIQIMYNGQNPNTQCPHWDKTHIWFVLKSIIEFNNDNCKSNSVIDTNAYSFHTNVAWMTSVKHIRQDIVSYFRQHFFSYFYYNLSIKFDNVYKYPWKNSSKVICIHLRLEDVTHLPDYNGKLISQFWNDTINDESFDFDINRSKFNKYLKEHNYPTYTRIGQAPLSDSKIEMVISFCKRKYPDHEIHIITAPVSRNVVKLPYNICKNETLEHDIWCMMNADVLIGSRSTLSMLAMIGFKGKHIFYPLWNAGSWAGLSTKFDKNTNITWFE